MVSDSAIALLELVLQVFEQRGVALRIDLGAQDPLGADDRQRGDLFAQRVLRTLRREPGLFFRGLLGGGNDAGRLGAGLLDDLAGLPFGGGTSVGGTLAGGLELLLDPALGDREVGLGLVGGGQAVGDTFRAVIQRLGDRWPDELGHEPPQRQKDHDLDEQCRVQIHGSLPVSFLRESSVAAARITGRGWRTRTSSRYRRRSGTRRRSGPRGGTS